jgi:hypothetical protein
MQAKPRALSQTRVLCTGLITPEPDSAIPKSHPLLGPTTRIAAVNEAFDPRHLKPPSNFEKTATPEIERDVSATAVLSNLKMFTLRHLDADTICCLKCSWQARHDSLHRALPILTVYLSLKRDDVAQESI